MTEKARTTLKELLQVEKCPHHSHVFSGYYSTTISPISNYSIGGYNYSTSYNVTTTVSTVNSNTWGGILGGLAGLGAGQSQTQPQLQSQYYQGQAAQQAWSQQQMQQQALPQQYAQYQYQTTPYPYFPEPYSKQAHIWKFKVQGNPVKYVEFCEHHSPASPDYEKTEL